MLQITNACSVLGCVRLGQQHFASISHQCKWIAKQRRSRTVVLQELIENLSELSLPGEVFGYCIASEKIPLLKFGWKLFLVFLNCSVIAACADLGWEVRLCWAGPSQRRLFLSSIAQR